MIRRVEDLEDGDLVARHPAKVPELQLVAPLAQVAAADELFGHVLELLHVVQRRVARVADGQRPLLDDAPERAPHAVREEEIVVSRVGRKRI